MLIASRRRNTTALPVLPGGRRHSLLACFGFAVSRWGGLFGRVQSSRGQGDSAATQQQGEQRRGRGLADAPATNTAAYADDVVPKFEPVLLVFQELGGTKGRGEAVVAAGRLSDIGNSASW